MNPDLLLHHQGSLTSLRAIAWTDGTAGAATLPLLHGLSIRGPLQDVQAQGGTSWITGAQMCQKGLFFFKFF